jgi:dynactin complex subunit
MTKTEFVSTDGFLSGKNYKQMYKDLERQVRQEHVLEGMYWSVGKDRLEQEKQELSNENRDLTWDVEKLENKVEKLEKKLRPLEDNLKNAIEEAKRHEMQELENKLKKAQDLSEAYRYKWLEQKNQLEQLQAQQGSDRQFNLTIENILDMPENWNYYHVLGISANTRPQEIARVFTKVKSPLWHPDKWSKYSPTLRRIAEHVFKLLKEASDNLCADPQEQIPDQYRRRTWSLQHITTGSIFYNPYTVS